MSALEPIAPSVALVNFNYSGTKANIAVRFYDYFKFAVRPDLGEGANRGGPQEYKIARFVEKAGNVGLWVVEKMPRKIGRFLKDPRVVTIALAAFAIIAVSFAFYPANSILVFKVIAMTIPHVPLWAAKFSAYIFTVHLIVSTTMRALGRLCNETLTNQFIDTATK